MADDLKTLEEQQKLYAQLIEQQKEAKALGKELSDIDKQLLASTKERVAALSQGIAGLEKSKVNLEKEVAHYDKLLKAEGEFASRKLSRFEREQINNSREAAQMELVKKETDLLLAQLAKGEEIDEERLKLLMRQTNQYAQQDRYLQQANDLAAGMAGIMKGYAAHPLFNAENMKKLAGGIAGAFQTPGKFVKSLASGLLSNFLNSVIGLVFEMDKAEAGFVKATGASKKMQDSMRGVYSEVRANVVSMEQLYATVGDLAKVYTDFTMISQDAAAQVAKVSSTMVQAGHSASAVAKDMQMLSVAFGQTATEASDTLMELDAFARDIGVPPAQLSEQFGQMGEKLAKLGDQGVGAFKELARVSKITGFEMGKLLDLTDKFDSFEEAAKMTGGLNAALGGNFVNAMEMMTATNPVERFNMIRESLEGAGLEFDNMSYYQRKFFAQQLGLKDSADLAAVMRGDMESLDAEIGKTADDYEALAQRAREAANFQERLQAIMQKMIPVLTPLIDGIELFISTFEKGEKQQTKFSDKAIAVSETLGSLSTAFKVMIGVLTTLIDWWFVAVPVFIAFKGFLFALKIGMINVGAAATPASAGMRGFAMSIRFVSKAAFAGVKGLAILSGVLLSVGAAAAGVGYAAHGVAAMFESIDIKKLEAFSAFVLKTSLSPLIYMSAATAIGGMATALGAVGAALSVIPMDKLKMLQETIYPSPTIAMNTRRLSTAAMQGAMAAPVVGAANNMAGAHGQAPAKGGDIKVAATIPVYLDGKQIAKYTAKEIEANASASDAAFGADRGWTSLLA